MHNTAVLYGDSRAMLSKGGFFKGDTKDSLAHWKRNASTWKWRSEECNNFYHIQSVEKNADELKTKFCAS